jgi:CHAT domain-containing protein
MPKAGYRVLRRPRRQWRCRALLASLLVHCAAAAVAWTFEQRPLQDDLQQRRDTLDARLRQLHKYGRLPEALAAAREKLELTRAQYGPQHTMVGDDLRHVVQLLLDRGDYPAAQRHARELVALRDAVDADRPWLAAEARASLRYVERIIELQPPQEADLRRAAQWLLQEAARFDALGKPREALEAAQRGLQLRRQVLGYADGVYIEQLVLQGVRQSRLGQTQASEAAFAEGLHLLQELYGTQYHRDYAATLQAVALVRRQAGRLPEAIALLQQASDIFHTVLGAQHDTSRNSLDLLAGACRALAEQHYRAGDFAAAATAYEEEARHWARRHAEHHWHVREAWQWQRHAQRLDQLAGQQFAQVSRAIDGLQAALRPQGDASWAQRLPAMQQHLQTIESILGQGDPISIQAQLHVAAAQFDAQRSGPVAQAATALQGAIQQRRSVLGDDHPRTHEALDLLLEKLEDLADDRQHAGDWTGCLEAQRVALAARRQRYGPDHWRTRDAQIELAHRQRLAMLAPAQRQRVAQALEQIDEAAGLSDRGQVADAMSALQQALDTCDALLGAANRHSAACHHALGFLHEKLGHWPQAQEHFQRALALRQELLGSEHPQSAETWSTLGALYLNLGNDADAQHAMQRAVDICRGAFGPDSPRYAAELAQLALVAMYRKDAVAAEPMLQQAVELLRDAQGPHRTHYARALNNLGGLYAELGIHVLADPLYAEATEIWRQTGQWLNYARGLDNRASILQQRGDFQAAEPLQLEAVELFSTLLGASHADTAVAWANLAALYHWMGRADDAQRAARHWLDACRHGLDVASLLQSEREQLRWFARQRTSLDAYLALAPAAGRSPTDVYREVLAWKGSVFARQRHVRAGAGRAELQPLVEQLRESTARLATLALAPPQDRTQLDQWQQQVRAAAGRRDALERELLRAASQWAGDTTPAATTPQDIVQALPEGVALVDFLEYRRFEHVQRPGGHGWQVRSEWTAFVVRGDRPVVRCDLGPASEVSDAVQRWRAAHQRPVPGLAGEQAGADLRRLLWQPLEPHLQGVRTVLVAPDGAVARIPLGALPGRQQGTYLIDEVALAVVPVPQVLPHMLAAEGPLAALADMSPDGPAMLLLGDVDFDRADPMPPQGVPGEAPAAPECPGSSTSPAASSSSAASSGQAAPAGPETSPMLPGAVLPVPPESQAALLPDAVRSAAAWRFARLAGARDEMQAIAALYREIFPRGALHELRGADATEAAVRHAASGAAVMHFATHGFFASPQVRSALQSAASRGADPELPAAFAAERVLGVEVFHPGVLSALVLSGANRSPRPPEVYDNVLTAAEVAELDLRRTRLVVLSACETGLGEVAGGEGILGLQRAFQVAGVRSTVASLWKVDDDATRRLMTAFYRHLWSQRQGALEALRSAQRELLREPAGPFRSPYYWGAFVLSGDWR